MYHDQGHIPIKLEGRGNAFGISIGAPVLFGTVAHGSAHDIAGTGRADPAAFAVALTGMARLLEGPGIADGTATGGRVRAGCFRATAGTSPPGTMRSNGSSRCGGSSSASRWCCTGQATAPPSPWRTAAATAMPSFRAAGSGATPSNALITACVSRPTAPASISRVRPRSRRRRGCAAIRRSRNTTGSGSGRAIRRSPTRAGFPISASWTIRTGTGAARPLRSPATLCWWSRT